MGKGRDQEHCQQDAQGRPERPHDGALQQKDALNLALGSAHGPQNADLTAFLHDGHDQDAGNAQDHHHHHHTANQRGADGLGVQGRNHLGIGFLPAFDL